MVHEVLLRKAVDTAWTVYLKRETGLGVARPFVAAFSDAGLGDAIH